MFLFCLCMFLLSAGCASSRSSVPSSQRSSLPEPGYRKMARVATKSLRSPPVLVLAAGAAAVFLSGTDQNISDWATSAHPVFGSSDRARTASDYFRNAAVGTYLGAEAWRAIVTPSFVSSDDLLWTAGAGLMAIQSTSSITSIAKKETGRLRPDASDLLSFPSGHTSSATVFATLASGTFQTLDLSSSREWGLRAFAGLLAGMTAWGRVEGKKHYLSDVLAGAALGYVCGAFFNNLLLEYDIPSSVRIGSSASADGATLCSGLRSLFGRPPESDPPVSQSAG